MGGKSTKEKREEEKKMSYNVFNQYANLKAQWDRKQLQNAHMSQNTKYGHKVRE